jgi:uncharacterized protein
VPRVEHLICDYGLQPHPEGGYFRETYRSPTKLAGTERSVSTAIYYLLPEGQRSSLHRIDADELWHFYRGDPLLIVELQPGGPAKLTRLSAERPQHLVPAGTWFGSMPASGSAYCFVGCTVSPGFEFAHFELGQRDALLAEFPQATELITRLTP